MLTVFMENRDTIQGRQGSSSMHQTMDKGAPAQEAGA